MRSFGTATVLITLLALTGCGDGGGDADDVPTITTRPSTPASSAPTPATTMPTEPTEPTEPSTSAPQTTAPPTATMTPTETETGPSPEPPNDTTVGPTTYEEGLARIEAVDAAPSAGVTAIRFSTPDDVVYCLVDDPVIGPSCELRTGFIKDDRVCGGGAAEGVGRIETFEGEARPVCNTDTIREPGARVVSAPAVVTAGGDVDCAVERAGVTCVDTGAGAGFFIGPGEYHVF